MVLEEGRVGFEKEGGNVGAAEAEGGEGTHGTGANDYDGVCLGLESHCREEICSFLRIGGEKNTCVG